MHPADIKARLEKKGVTQLQIAAELDPPVTGMAVSNVILKKSISDRIMKKVSEKIGVDHCRVFPEYYLRKPKRSTSKATPIQVDL